MAPTSDVVGAPPIDEFVARSSGQQQIAGRRAVQRRPDPSECRGILDAAHAPILDAQPERRRFALDAPPLTALVDEITLGGKPQLAAPGADNRLVAALGIEPQHQVDALDLSDLVNALDRFHVERGLSTSPVAYGIAVSTGLAVVGNIGARDRMQNYTAIGDTVNTAQRLQSRAAANQILLSASTYQVVARQVRTHELAPMAVKGKTQPLPAYELLGLATP